ncbi:MAG: Fur family transcriptional regulator [Chloroflexota bacterium]|nr:Fur family transcriptional regulator [Chloroflexota bacterium]
MRLAEKKLTSALSQKGYKLTAPRQAVLNVIAGSREHLTPAAVHERVKCSYPRIGLVTVYRTLEMLSELGLICRVNRGGKSRCYTLAPSGHHHHLICSGCGAVADFANCDLEALEKRLEQETGFEIEGHVLEFSGRCMECARSANSKMAGMQND